MEGRTGLRPQGRHYFDTSMASNTAVDASSGGGAGAGAIRGIMGPPERRPQGGGGGGQEPAGAAAQGRKGGGTMGLFAAPGQMMMGSEGNALCVGKSGLDDILPDDEHLWE